MIKNMCEVLDVIENRGFEKGRAEGRAYRQTIFSIIDQLLLDRKYEEAHKVLSDHLMKMIENNGGKMA